MTLCKHSCALVDGKWSSWVSWGACSVSCGGGTRQRTRLCASPAPQHGGRQCEGNNVHIDFCNSEPCPGECLNTVWLSHTSVHTVMLTNTHCELIILFIREYVM